MASGGGSTGGTGQRGAGGLAFTGIDAVALTLFGVGTIVAGTMLVVSVRRRRRPGSDSLGCMLTVSVGYFLSTGSHHLSSAAIPASACDPGAQLPDAPMAVLLPGMAVIVFGVFWLASRRRDLFARSRP